MHRVPTYEVLVVDEEGVPVAGEVEPEGAEGGQAGPLVLPEQGVPKGQQGIALAQGIPHVLQRLLPKVPRLPPLGVDVRVGPEEGLVRPRLTEGLGRPPNVIFRRKQTRIVWHVTIKRGR